MESFVQSDFDAGLFTITLSRPEKRNALKRDFIQQLITAVDQGAANEEVRVVLLRAEGSVFCAGMDLGEMQSRAESESGKDEWQQDSLVYADLLQKLFELPVPTIAVLQGPVLAGGVGMVLACDMILASDNAFMMLPEPMRGIVAAMVTPFLVYRVGAGPAGQLLLSGERVAAERACALGLVHDCVPAEELDRRTEQLVQSVLTGSRSALNLTKQHLYQATGMDVGGLLRDSIEVSAKARETSDAREGLAAFLEKRKPNWQPQ